MTPREIAFLKEQVENELRGHLLDRARLDEQLEHLRRERKAVELRVSAARSMLRFADAALTTLDTPATPDPSESTPATVPAPPVSPTSDLPSREVLHTTLDSPASTSE